MTRLKIYNPRLLIGGLIFIAIAIGGFCWLLESDTPKPEHDRLVGAVVFLIHVYIALWGSCQPLDKKRNRNILFGFLFVIGAFIYWFFWLCFQDCSFDAKGLHLVVSKYHHFDFTYGWLIFEVLLVGFFLFIYFLHIFYFFHYPVPVKGNHSNTKTNGIGLMGTIGGAMLMDEFLHRKHKKHDHKLGSYWADHDDEGNYDPGAWRRKYDKR